MYVLDSVRPLPRLTPSFLVTPPSVIALQKSPERHAPVRSPSAMIPGQRTDTSVIRFRPGVFFGLLVPQLHPATRQAFEQTGLEFHYLVEVPLLITEELVA